MFDRVAIETSECASRAALSALASALGFEHGRLLAALPGSWTRDVYALLEGLPDGVDKVAARTLLSRVARHSVRCGASFDRAETWLTNAIRAMQAGRLEYVVASAAADGGVPDLWEFLAQVPAAHAELMPHTLNGFERTCRRLVEAAPRAVVVDPYCDLSLGRSLQVIAGLITWGSEGRCTDYDVYCRASAVLSTRANAECEFERLVKEGFEAYAYSKDARIRVFLLDDDRADVSPMHQRALITELGGIGVDYGFRIEDRRHSNVSVLTGRSLEGLQRQFYDGRHSYGVPRHSFDHWVRRAH